MLTIKWSLTKQVNRDFLICLRENFVRKFNICIYHSQSSTQIKFLVLRIIVHLHCPYYADVQQSQVGQTGLTVLGCPHFIYSSSLTWSGSKRFPLLFLSELSSLSRVLFGSTGSLLSSRPQHSLETVPNLLHTKKALLSLNKIYQCH